VQILAQPNRGALTLEQNAIANLLSLLSGFLDCEINFTSFLKG
jgi:hypothetical protein